MYSQSGINIDVYLGWVHLSHGGSDGYFITPADAQD